MINKGMAGKILAMNRHMLGVNRQQGILGSVSPSMIVCEDHSRFVRLHWLDCSQAEPKQQEMMSTLDMVKACDMCLVDGEDEKLLVIISLREDELIYACNSTTGKLRWTAVKKIPDTDKPFQSPSVTGDDSGHLFVLDITNKCIQMFVAADGQYLGCFKKFGEEDIGKDVKKLHWCKEISSLLVVYEKDGKILITDVH